jgi:signal transduction histidine kinase
MLHDITPIRRAEEREKRVLREQAEGAAGLERTKSDFLKVASHELRGPLGVLRGYLSLLSDGSLGEVTDSARPAVATMSLMTDQMEQLVSKMLEVARLEVGKVHLEIEAVDLVALTRSILEIRHRLASVEHEVAFEAPPSIFVQGDRFRLETIVLNLIDNSFKYSPDGGKVVIEMTEEGSLARVTITDQGLGIPSENLETIFQPFGRLVNAENSHIGGTGLGLYLSRELARLHGGSLTVTSALGTGSSFILRVPMATPLAAAVGRVVNISN